MKEDNQMIGNLSNTLATSADNKTYYDNPDEYEKTLKSVIHRLVDGLRGMVQDRQQPDNQVKYENLKQDFGNALADKMNKRDYVDTEDLLTEMAVSEEIQRKDDLIQRLDLMISILDDLQKEVK